jgi:hypothetical protein
VDAFQENVTGVQRHDAGFNLVTFEVRNPLSVQVASFVQERRPAGFIATAQMPDHGQAGKKIQDLHEIATPWGGNTIDVIAAACAERYVIIGGRKSLRGLRRPDPGRLRGKVSGARVTDNGSVKGPDRSGAAMQGVC